VVGRYALGDEIASGGVATVHLGRLLGQVGFARTVAIKRLLPQFAKDPEFSAMLIDEARLAARIRHPNVVPTLDVVSIQGELLLVMEYVHGESLSRILRGLSQSGERVPAVIASAVMCGVLDGLHAAHDAKNERGEPLELVHRDVSPQNVLVGIDGIARVLDFGVAKAAGRLTMTREGLIKGKLGYMSPEHFRGASVDRRSDVFAASVVLWELLTNRRLFSGDDVASLEARVANASTLPPSTYAPELSPSMDALVARGLSVVPSARFGTAREMATELAQCVPPAAASEVAEWVERTAGDALAKRAEQLARVEQSFSSDAVAPPSAGMGAEGVGRRRERRSRVAVSGAGLAIAIAAAILVSVVRHRAPGVVSPLASDPPPSGVLLDAQPAPPPVAPPPGPQAMPRLPQRSAEPVLRPHRSAPGANCQPPYVLDSQGVRHYKDGCL
jgi:hypothetical protein